MNTPDFQITNHGSIIMFLPLTDDATTWWNDNVDPDAMMLGNAYAVEPRYAEDIVDGIVDYGMTVQ